MALLFLFQNQKAEAACSYPAQVLDISNCKQTLPVGKSGKPKEVTQPALATYTSDPFFKANATCDGVIFRAPVNGVTTSNSGYPRSELREMTNGGKDNAKWSTTSGTHTMFIDEAITAVPKKKKHVVAGQIHGADDDLIVVRLEFPKLFIDINGKTGPTLDAKYTLGKRFTVKFVAEGGKVKIYYNGSQNPIYTLNKSTSGCYFKAGAYTQSNCSKESDCSSNNFGEVVIYNLSLNGQVIIPKTETTPPAASLTVNDATVDPAPVVVALAPEAASANTGVQVAEATSENAPEANLSDSEKVVPVVVVNRSNGWFDGIKSFSIVQSGKIAINWTSNSIINVISMLATRLS